MLPLGVANNLIPRPNPPLPSPAPTTFAQSDAANLPVGRYQLDAAAAAAAPGSLNSPASNYLGAPRSLGAEGGLFSAIQNQGSGGLAGIQLSPPGSSGSSLGSPNYPPSGSASGNYPSSLSSSGSLANLGIVPSKFEDPPTHDLSSSNPSASAGGIDSGSTGTSASSSLPKELPNRSTPQVHHGILLSIFFLFVFLRPLSRRQRMNTLLQPTI